MTRNVHSKTFKHLLHTHYWQSEADYLKVILKIDIVPGQEVILCSLTCSNSTNPQCECQWGKVIEFREQTGCDRWLNLWGVSQLAASLQAVLPASVLKTGLSFVDLLILSLQNLSVFILKCEGQQCVSRLYCQYSSSRDFV